MNKQENSTLDDSLFDCFENQDWSSVIEILTEHYYCCQHVDTNTYRVQQQEEDEEEEEEEEELEDIFENFLFRVDEQISTEHITEETASKIIQLFLSLLTTTSPCSLYAVAQAPTEEDTKNDSLVGGEDADEGSHQYSPTCPTISTPDANAVRTAATTPLIHNLCIENKHIALALLLRTLDPTVASREVQKVAHIIFDYEEEIVNSTTRDVVADDAGHTLPQSLYHTLNVYHTPLQAAWAGTLLDKQRFDNLDQIRQYDDLTDVQADLWTTTVYLLLAFDGKPISLDFATGGDWNMLPVISRYGPRCYDAVMMVALRLYPHLAQSAAAAVASHMIEVDGNGDDDGDDYDLLDLDLPDRIFECPLHEACKHQICYRPAAAAGGGAARLDVSVLVAVVTGSGGLETEGGDHNAHHSPHLSLNRTSGLPVSCVHFPAIMLLKQDQSAAFMLDTCGRLPLHLALMHHSSNWDILAAIASTNESGENDDKNSNEEEDMYEEDEESIAVEGVNDYVIYSVPLIKALVQTNPKALEHAEPSTGLYPFLLAAASNYTSSTSLDMLFFLLNSNPSVAVNNVLH